MYIRNRDTDRDMDTHKVWRETFGENVTYMLGSKSERESQGQ